MVLLTTTPQILEVLSSLPPSVLSILTHTETTTKDTTSLTSIALPTSLTTPISHKTLIALSRLRHTHKNGSLTNAIPPLNTLLRGTKPYVAPPVPKPTPTPEYTALMARLRLEAEQREYASLLAKQRTTLSLTEQIADESADPISPSLVLNILLSIVMCAIAMFQMTKWWANDGVRVLMSLATGLVVGVAEVGVYSIYLMKVKNAREKERGKKEKKSFIAEYTGEDEGRDGTGEQVRIVGEKEEIWGRGVNGGMRRRVREKWEREQEKEMDEGAE